VSRVILLRSIIFNIAFYLNVIIWLIAALPTFFMPYRAIVGVAKAGAAAISFCSA
jgi:1-acyl-sn-glycerol-3-phosphate acyltransferase